MVTVLAPLAYIGFLVGSLYIFGRIYRRRKAAQSVYEPWFPKHNTRDIYVSLLSQKTQPPTNVLVAALIRRTMTDVERIWNLRESKNALSNLLQKGQIGDDLWARFTTAEKELEAEIMEVVEEANTFKQGWGQSIFAQASDMVQHERYKKQFLDVHHQKITSNSSSAETSPRPSSPQQAKSTPPTSTKMSPQNSNSGSTGGDGGSAQSSEPEQTQKKNNKKKNKKK